MSLVVLLLASCGGRPTPSPPSTTIWFGGDVHLGDGSAGSTRLAAIGGLVEAGTPGWVNLEGPISDRPTAFDARSATLFNHRGAPTELAAAGVRFVGVVNNHSGDAGPDGRAATGEALSAADLVPIDETPFVLHDGPGVRVALTAFDLGDGPPPGLTRALQVARASSDFQVVAFHVTGPASYLPAGAVFRASVEAALDEGADLVLSTGTHVVGPVERRGDAVIAWGLGNLVFDCACSDGDEGLLLEATFTPHEGVAARVVPVQAGLQGAPARPHARPAELLDLLASIGSTIMTRDATSARF